MAASETALRISIALQGTDMQQIRILSYIIEDVIEQQKIDSSHPLHSLFVTFQQRFQNTNKLDKAIVSVNKLIILLERLDDTKNIVNYLKEHGLYRILYRNPRLKGRELPRNDLLRLFLRAGLITVGVCALFIIFFIAAPFLALPAWLTAVSTGLFAGASAYLSGLLYAVINNLFAAHANLPYFLLGHHKEKTSLLRTNDKIAQGVAWGIATTFAPVLFASIIFAVITTIAAFFVPIATFVLPIIMIAMPLFAVRAEFYARRKTQYYLKETKDCRLWLNDINDYQAKGLAYMCPTNEERAAWHANSVRNLFGFKRVPIIGWAGLTSLIILSATSMFLPTLLFTSPIIAVAIPAAFALAAFVSVAAAGIYMHHHRNTQVDNRYRLNFDENNTTLRLYIDDDLEYVDKLLKKHAPKTEQSLDTNPPPLSTPYPLFSPQTTAPENTTVQSSVQHKTLDHVNLDPCQIN